MAEPSQSSERVLDLEREADPDGAWIPYCVRMKLDLVGLKFGLDAWRDLSEEARAALIAAPARTDADLGAFAALVERAVGAGCSVLSEHGHDRIAAWRDGGEPTDEVRGVLARVAGSPTGADALWAGLDMFGRYLVHAFARKDDADGLARALGELRLHEA